MIVFRSAVLVITGPIAIRQMFHSSCGTFRCKRQCSPLAILPLFVSPFDPFLVRPLVHQRSPDLSSVHSSNKSITRKQATALFRPYFYKFVLRDAILLFPFLRRKSLELAALAWLCLRHCSAGELFCQMTVRIFFGLLGSLRKPRRQRQRQREGR